MNLFDLRILRLAHLDGQASVERIGVKQLLRENMDRRYFVEAVLQQVTQGKLYDDSDANSGVYVYYLPDAEVELWVAQQFRR